MNLKSFMNLNVKKKLQIAFLIMIILISVLGIFNTISLRSINQDLRNLYDFHLKGIKHINNAKSDLISIGRGRSDLISSRSPEERERNVESIRLLFTEFENNLEHTNKTIIDKDGQKIMTEIYDLWEVLKPNEEKAIAEVLSYSNVKAYYVGIENRELSSEIELKIEKLINLKDSAALKSYKDGNTKFTITLVLTLAFIILSIILGFIISRYMNSIIATPITQIADTIQQVSDGNLFLEDVLVESNDEIGQLGNSLNLMVHNLRSVVGNILDASQQVASTSEELSASSDETTSATEEIANAMNELAEGSSQQARDASETSVVVGKMTSNIEEIVNNVHTVSKISEDVSSEATNGIKESEKAIIKIQRIKEVTEESVSRVKILGSESLKIGEIVEVIRGISDQTNLLALNAAIEAARAGEHGRGFTVVADEVRTLAEQSSNSALEIAELINRIQSETQNVVNVMDIATNEVTEGVQAVNKTGIAFNLIYSEIEKINDGIQQVSKAIGEIAHGSQSLDSNIEGIAAISQEAAASSQEVSAASEEQAASMVEIANAAQELAELAELLQENVSIFKLS